jgi:hypothetical protein
MRAEEHVERNSGEIPDGKQQIAVWQVLAGFPVAPSGGGDTKPACGNCDGEVLAQSPVPEPHAKHDAGGVMMTVISGMHRGDVAGSEPA